MRTSALRSKNPASRFRSFSDWMSFTGSARYFRFRWHWHRPGIRRWWSRRRRVAAREASATGIRWTFSPMVDIARDARWGRITEGAGEDPFLGSEMAAAYVRGYQGTRLDAPDSIAACAKHFVGYGAAEGGRDYNTTEISEHTLRQIYLPPFRAAVDAGAATIMSAFNSLNGVPASANPFTLRQILREEWGFRGVVDSDWESVREMIQHGIANDRATAALQGLHGAASIWTWPAVSITITSRSWCSAGQVPQERIDESVRNVLRLKLALGLFERPYADEAREARSHAAAGRRLPGADGGRAFLRVAEEFPRTERRAVTSALERRATHRPDRSACRRSAERARDPGPASVAARMSSLSTLRSPSAWERRT